MKRRHENHQWCLFRKGTVIECSNLVMGHHHLDQGGGRTWGLPRQSWPRASNVVVSKHGIANRMGC